MNLALVLVHNKGDKANVQQIDTLKSLLQEVTVPLFNTETNDKGETVEVPILDEQGTQKQGFSHYIFPNLPFPHEVKVFQIVPYQPTNTSDPYNAVRPVNMKELISHDVLYGKDDEDKVGDHPRFFNWGLKRGTDYGADIVVHIDDIKKFSVDDLAIQVNTLIDPTNKTEYIEDLSVKIGTLKLLKEVGQLDETKTKLEAIEELKGKLEVKVG